MLPQFFTYVLSFLVIGSFWNSHHTKFRYVRRYNRTLITLNLLLLMAVAFIPFPTSVLGESGNATATILYASAIVLASLLSALEWWYAVRRDLLMESTSQHDRRYQARAAAAHRARIRPVDPNCAVRRQLGQVFLGGVDTGYDLCALTGRRFAAFALRLRGRLPGTVLEEAGKIARRIA